MNWWKNISIFKQSSSLGITIKKWLEQADKGFYDENSMMNDFFIAIDNDGESSSDILYINNAISEAVTSLNDNYYNEFQNNVINAAKSLSMNQGYNGEAQNA